MLVKSLLLLGIIFGSNWDLSLAFATRDAAHQHSSITCRRVRPWSTYNIARFNQKDPPFNTSGGLIEKTEDNQLDMTAVALGMWIAGISTFILMNYYGSEPWPSGLLRVLNERQWMVIHQFSAMMFSGVIVISSLIEATVVKSSDSSQVKEFWFKTVPQLDAAVMAPFLTLMLLSGVANTAIRYDTLGEAPAYILHTLRALVVFAIWWVVTDKTTQSQAKKVDWDTCTGTPLPIKLRLISNAVSCLFVATLYGAMVFKPGI